MHRQLWERSGSRRRPTPTADRHEREAEPGSNHKKGYGFITPGDAGKDLFGHHSAIAGSGFKSLAESVKVSFDTEQGTKGPTAASVRVL